MKIKIPLYVLVLLSVIIGLFLWYKSQNTVDAYVTKVDSHLAANDIDGALILAKEGIKKNHSRNKKNLWELYRKVLDIMIERKQYSDAEEYIDIGKLDSNTVRLYYEILANKAWERKDWESSKRLYRKFAFSYNWSVAGAAECIRNSIAAAVNLNDKDAIRGLLNDYLKFRLDKNFKMESELGTYDSEIEKWCELFSIQLPEEWRYIQKRE